MFEKSICRFRFGPALTRFRNLRLRVGVKITRDHHQPPTQSLIQAGPAEFLLRPILGLRPELGRRLRFGSCNTQLFPRLTVQLIDKHPLDRYRSLVRSEEHTSELQSPC